MIKYIYQIFVFSFFIIILSVCGSNGSTGDPSTDSAVSDAAPVEAEPELTSPFTEQADTYTGDASDESLTPLGGGDSVDVGTGTDTINYTATGQTFSGFVSPGTTVLTGIDIISGMGAGDKISLFAEAMVTSATGVSPNLLISGDARDLIALVRGNYDETTKQFTEIITGADTLLQWDLNGTGVGGELESVLLKSYVQTNASQRSNGVITLQ